MRPIMQPHSYTVLVVDINQNVHTNHVKYKKRG